jgi:hypothetical protein
VPQSADPKDLFGLLREPEGPRSLLPAARKAAVEIDSRALAQAE